MTANNQKPPSVPKFSSEHEEADWWSSPEGRQFLKSQPPHTGVKSGHGSERVTQLAHATNAQSTPSVLAEAEAKAQLKASFDRFISESDPSMKNEAGRDLIRSIFGDDAIAEDPVR